MKNLKEETKNQRVVTFLNRDEVDFLDKLGKDALFSTGVKLSRTRLIAWLIDLAKALNIDGTGVTSEEDLEKKVFERLQITTKGTIPPATEGNYTPVTPQLKSMLGVPPAGQGGAS